MEFCDFLEPSLVDGVPVDGSMSRKEKLVTPSPAFTCCVSGSGGSGGSDSSGNSSPLVMLGSVAICTGGMKAEVRGSSVLARQD
jgi:hypothetical protein